MYPPLTVAGHRAMALWQVVRAVQEADSPPRSFQYLPSDLTVRRAQWCQHGMVIIPAMPVLLRMFADRLREDQGRQLGRAVLFASIVGFDVVEQRKGDIAVVSGVPVARIQEIVDTADKPLIPPRRDDVNST